MLRNFFVYKTQCELSCPKSTRKVSELLKNARQNRSATKDLSAFLMGPCLWFPIQLKKYIYPPSLFLSFLKNLNACLRSRNLGRSIKNLIWSYFYCIPSFSSKRGRVTKRHDLFWYQNMVGFVTGQFKFASAFVFMAV